MARAGRVLAQQAVPVIPLVGATATWHRRVRLGPRQEPLEERPAPEHAAGRRIGRDDRVIDPDRPERRGHLDRPGPAADDDDGILAGRERVGRRRARGQARHRFAARNRRAWTPSIRYITRGWAIRNGSTRGPASTRQRSGVVATHIRDRRLAEDDRDLAEEVAPTQPGPFGPVDHDRRLALEDHVEPGAGEALAQDLVALAEHGLFEEVDDALQLWIGQVGEQAEPGDRIHQLRAIDHDHQWCQMRRRHGRGRGRLTARSRAAQHGLGSLRQGAP